MNPKGKQLQELLMAVVFMLPIIALSLGISIAIIYGILRLLRIVVPGGC